MSDTDMRELLRPHDLGDASPSEIDAVIARGLLRRRLRRGLQAIAAASVAVVVGVVVTLTTAGRVPDIAETPGTPRTSTAPSEDVPTPEDQLLSLTAAAPQVGRLAPFDAITPGHGSLWLATGATNPETAQVLRVTPDGQSIVASVQIPAGALEATTDAIWAALVGGHDLDVTNSITRIDPATNTADPSIDLAEFEPSFLAADGQVLWVSTGHPSPSRILRVGPAGDVTGPWTLGGFDTDGITGFDVREGRAYVVTLRGAAAVFDLEAATGDNMTLTPIRNGKLTPDDSAIFTSAAIGPDGTLWIGRQGSGPPLYRWNSDGAVRSYGKTVGGGHVVAVARDRPVVVGGHATVWGLTDGELVKLTVADASDDIQQVATDGAQLWITTVDGLWYTTLGVAPTPIASVQTVCARSATGTPADVDGDGVDEQIMFDESTYELVVCGGPEELSRVGWSGGETLYVGDIEPDGRADLFFGGTTATAAGQDVAVWIDGAMAVIETGPGNPLSLWDGYLAWDVDRQVASAYGQWGCQDLDSDGRREIVSVHYELATDDDRYDATITWYRLEAADAVVADQESRQIAVEGDRPTLVDLESC